MSNQPMPEEKKKANKKKNQEQNSFGSEQMILI